MNDRSGAPEIFGLSSVADREEADMGDELRAVLEEGVRVAFGPQPDMARFVARHRVSPSLAQLLRALRFTFRSSVDALGWLDCRQPALGRSPFDLIAAGEVARVVRALDATAMAMSA
ncbi:MAG TPA: hypothetical protein VFZ69_05000 [Longimicrobiales bacterium]